jgi:hypothetical protein
LDGRSNVKPGLILRADGQQSVTVARIAAEMRAEALKVGG